MAVVDVGEDSGGDECEEDERYSRARYDDRRLFCHRFGCSTGGWSGTRASERDCHWQWHCFVVPGSGRCRTGTASSHVQQ